MQLDFSRPIQEQYNSFISFYTTLLDLSENKLGERTCEELAAVFQAIPKNITSLILNHNELFKSKSLAQIFNAIPKSVVSLSLRKNHLEYMAGADLAAAFKFLPDQITSLNLSDNGFGNKRIEAFVTILKAIPTAVTSLDLGNTRLGKLTDKELTIAFKALPSHVTSLNLWRNNLCSKPLSIKAIPQQVTSLDLGGTGVDGVILQSIPNHVSSLGLSHNKLGLKTGEALAAELALIPSGVTYLDLRGNELDSMNIKELILALTSIPNSVKKVSLGLNTRPTQRSLEEQNLLRHALSEKGFCLEGNGSDLQPSSIAAVDGVIPIHPLQDLIYSYLSQPGETLPTRPLSSPVIPPIKPQPASQSGQSLLGLQHGFFNESYHSPSFKNKLGIDNDCGPNGACLSR